MGWAFPLRAGVLETHCCFSSANRVSVLDAWRPHSTLSAGRSASSRAGRDCDLATRRQFVLRSATAARSRHICQMSKSDFTSQLEVEKPDRKPSKQANGIFWILLLNLAVFVADHLLQLQQVKSLYLYHRWPAWYQFVTSTFCHADWNHLSSNLFFLYIFGKLVEEEEGSLGLWISYTVTGVGANLVSWLLLPKSAVSMGASGAVFGLFTISVLVKLSWDWRKILEVLILGQFVIDKVMEAARYSTSFNGGLGRENFGVNHIAHFSGALIGAALIFLITRVPSQSPNSDSNIQNRKDKK